MQNLLQFFYNVVKNEIGDVLGRKKEKRRKKEYEEEGMRNEEKVKYIIKKNSEIFKKNFNFFKIKM